jgi:hypothetical protein
MQNKISNKADIFLGILMGIHVNEETVSLLWLLIMLSDLEV